MKWKKQYWYVLAIAAAVAAYYFWKKNQTAAPAPVVAQAPATAAQIQARLDKSAAQGRDPVTGRLLDTR